jgi:CO/xanthine dehydrogenase FAD-binding subunit
VNPFEYMAPTTIAEALAALAWIEGSARPLAGGTDLIVQMRLGVLEIRRVVDVKRIHELNAITHDVGRELSIGAAVPCCRIIEHADIRSIYPALVDAVSIIGGTGIQGRATLGGNLCNAAPSADSIPAMIVLGAYCRIVGPAGIRTIGVERFCTGPGKTVLARDELLVSVHFPAPVDHAGACYLRFIPRHEMDIAVVGVGASVVLSADNATIKSGRIALGAVGPTPIDAEKAGAVLRGKVPSEETFAETARLAQEDARPITDVRGTEKQRRHLVGVLTRRALRKAVERAKGGAFRGF